MASFAAEADAGLPATTSCCTQLLATDPQNTTTLYAFACAPRAGFKTLNPQDPKSVYAGGPGGLFTIRVVPQ